MKIRRDAGCTGSFISKSDQHQFISDLMHVREVPHVNWSAYENNPDNHLASLQAGLSGPVVYRRAERVEASQNPNGSIICYPLSASAQWEATIVPTQ